MACILACCLDICGMVRQQVNFSSLDPSPTQYSGIPCSCAGLHWEANIFISTLGNYLCPRCTRLPKILKVVVLKVVLYCRPRGMLPTLDIADTWNRGLRVLSATPGGRRANLRRFQIIHDLYKFNTCLYNICTH